MPIFAPFRGIRYNPDKVGNLARVITQPYDKITPRLQEDYYAASEYNFVRLILNRESDPYRASQTLLARWLAEGVLVKDPAPAIYPYRQIFTLDGRTRVRRSLIGLCKLEPLEGGRVLPHERTLAKPKTDRLNLMRATKKQFEQVFMLYPDDQDKINKLIAPIWKWTPEIEVSDEAGVTHCLWRINDARTIRAVVSLFRPKTFVIADGHHRYETALNYRDEMRRKLSNLTGREAFNYRLVACVNLADPALVILPTHRLVRGIAEFSLNDFLSRAARFFTISPRLALEEIPRLLATSSRTRERHQFLVYAGPDRLYAFTLGSISLEIERMFPPERSPDYRKLDVAILHTVIIEHLLGIAADRIEEHVSYEREWQSAKAEVDRGGAQLAFLVHPTRPEQVRRIAEGWERMPQKSTDFYPKLASGLVFFDADEQELIA